MSENDSVQSRKKLKAKIYCPECNQVIKLNKAQLGQRIICRACNAALELVSINPPEVETTMGAEIKSNRHQKKSRRR